jgi:hypothetical protein
VGRGGTKHTRALRLPADSGRFSGVTRTLYIAIAFALGVVLTYGVLRLYPPARLESQEWGVVVTTFGEGARLYGLFESKEKCTNARKGYIDDYGLIAAKAVPVEKGSRTVVLKEPHSGALLAVTFSCLPLSEIRGLSLVTSGDGPKGE